jgi:hypothetical protein
MTAALMRLFYHKPSPAGALREAQLILWQLLVADL